MALMQTVIIASVFIAALFVQQGLSIHCYICNSHNPTESECSAEVVPKSFLFDCSRKGSKHTFCRKIKQIIEFSVNGLPPDTRIIRSCGFDNSTHYNACYQRAGFGGRQEVCACDTAECNTANSIPIATYLTISFASIAVLYSTFF